MVKVLIIGASRGIGLETVKAARRGIRCARWRGQPEEFLLTIQSSKNGRRRARNGHGEARADWSWCCHPVARRFGRARNHPQADAAFLQSDAGARHRDGATMVALPRTIETQMAGAIQ